MPARVGAAAYSRPRLTVISRQRQEKGVLSLLPLVSCFLPLERRVTIRMIFVNKGAPLLWQRRVLEFPWGELRLYFSEAGIGHLVLPGNSFGPQGEPPFATAGELPWPGLETELQDFMLRGRAIWGTYPLLADDYSAWTLKVLQHTVAIPFGETLTYGEIAASTGNRWGARAVGQALGRNHTPLLIPCHRVLGKGVLGGFGSGVAWKRRLLKLEGHDI